jgi:hypothetical protein
VTAAELDREQLRLDAEDWEAEVALDVETARLIDGYLATCRFPRLHWLKRLRSRWAWRRAEFGQAAEARAWARYNAAGGSFPQD